MNIRLACHFAAILGLLVALPFNRCWSKPCDSYRHDRKEILFQNYKIVIGKADDNRSVNRACYSIEEKERVVSSGMGYNFGIGSLYEDEKKETLLSVGRNITGNGKPNLVLFEHTGGMHCCLFFHLFELGKTFRKIQTIDLAHADLVDFANLDGDPALELPLNDWTFAYWKTGFATSPAPRIVLKYKDGQYRTAPNLMKKSLPSPQELEALAKSIRESPDWQDAEADPPVDLLAEILSLIYTGHMKEAEAFLNKAWPEGREGREAYWQELKAQLAKSPYWKEIHAMSEK